MKQKVKDFLVEKKELFIFLGVLLVVFTLVLTIASLNNEVVPVDAPYEETTTTTPTTTLPSTTTVITTTNDPRIYEKMSLPIASSHTIVREFFDPEGTLEARTNAIIDTGNGYVSSYGVSYATLEGNEFPVLAALSGEVVTVETSDTYGSIVRINHLDGIVTEYQSLSAVNVAVGDKVSIGQNIGVSGTSIYDAEANNHVHFLVYKDQAVINPNLAIGRMTNKIEVDLEK